MKCVFVTVYIFIFNINKVLDVSIWKSPVAGWGWESVEAKDDWLRWLPVPFGLGFHLTMCVWPLPPLILGWPNRKPWWQQPFANRPGVMVRIAIGFYVDSKNKWSGCSTHLSIKKCCEKPEKNISDCHLVHIKSQILVYVSLHCLRSIWQNSVFDHNLCAYFLCLTGVERSWKNITV